MIKAIVILFFMDSGSGVIASDEILLPVKFKDYSSCYSFVERDIKLNSDKYKKLTGRPLAGYIAKCQRLDSV